MLAAALAFRLEGIAPGLAKYNFAHRCVPKFNSGTRLKIGPRPRIRA